MSQDYGIQAPRASHHAPAQEPARYLVMIDGPGGRVAKLFLGDRSLVAEFDAASEEATQLVQALQPDHAAASGVWDEALAGHSDDERAQALVYTLAI